MTRRPWAVGMTALALAATIQVVLAAPASAGEKTECGRFADDGGLVCVTIDAVSPQSIVSYGGSFTSVTTVTRPRLRIDLLDDLGKRIDVFESTWDTNRIREVVSKPVDKSLATAVGRVCANLFQPGGELLGTACISSPTAGG